MPKAIPKSDRPWRQRLADAARLRNAQGETADEPENYLTNSKIIAARDARRQSLTMVQNSPLLNANQQLQTQISELRNLVSDDKVKNRKKKALTYLTYIFVKIKKKYLN